MGKIFWQINTTLDGFMEDVQGKLEETAEIGEPAFEAYASNMLESIDAFIVGRKTYEMFVGYWPTAPGRDAEILNAIPKYVVSTTLESADWNNATLVKGDLTEEIGSLRSKFDRDVAVFGSSSLAASLIELGLIDELRVIVSPRLLGEGGRTFKSADAGSLELVGLEQWPSGTILLTYKIS